MPAQPPAPTSIRSGRRLFATLTAGGERNFLDTLRAERTGGLLLVLGAATALIWANSPWSTAYRTVTEAVIGPAALHLDLSIAQWATDGLLAIFFFVVGVELKREIVTGELRRMSTAVVPVVAAVGGMAVPALLYLLVNVTADDGVTRGWAVPTATDIAFAVAVLAIVGRGLPTSVRAFLLTLAVVDDLLGIVIIAVVYTQSVHLVWLAAAALAVIAFAALTRSRFSHPGVLIVLALAAWALMHSSGVHATIAGVILGLTAPARTRTGESHSIAERWEHRWRPVSAGVAVPIFALCSTGVNLTGNMIVDALHDPVAQGVALGLVFGKPIGILAATWLVATFTGAQLADGLHWRDLMGVGALAGMGFTVSLLIGSLAFGTGSPHDEHLTVAILFASLTAAVVGGTILSSRHRHDQTAQMHS